LAVQRDYNRKVTAVVVKVSGRFRGRNLNQVASFQVGNPVGNTAVAVVLSLYKPAGSFDATRRPDMPVDSTLVKILSKPIQNFRGVVLLVFYHPKKKSLSFRIVFFGDERTACAATQ